MRTCSLQEASPALAAAPRLLNWRAHRRGDRQVGGGGAGGAGEQDEDEEDEEAAARRERRAKRRTHIPRPGEALAAGERTVVTVLSRPSDILGGAGSGVPHAAAAFLHERLVGRHKRTRGTNRAGVPLDFASAAVA